MQETDAGSILGSGRSPGGGNGKPLQYSCLENPIDRGASWTVILQARILEWVAFPFSRGSSNPGVERRSPTLQVDSLPAEPPGKPKNTAVGSLSLLQLIFLTQESNQGLLHCRRILYQLNYQGSQPLPQSCIFLKVSNLPGNSVNSCLLFFFF